MSIRLIQHSCCIRFPKSALGRKLYKIYVALSLKYYLLYTPGFTPESHTFSLHFIISQQPTKELHLTYEFGKKVSSLGWVQGLMVLSSPLLSLGLWVYSLDLNGCTMPSHKPLLYPDSQKSPVTRDLTSCSSKRQRRKPFSLSCSLSAAIPAATSKP